VKAALVALARRELALRLRGGGWAASLGLFAVATALAPLGIGRDAALLAQAGPGILWLAASLSLLLGLDSLFEEDLRTGGLDLLRLSPLPLPLVALVKIACGWGATCLPLVLASPVLLLAFGLPAGNALGGTLGVLLGTPALALLAGTLGALLSGLRRGTGLLVFLALPLFAPALVFGAASTGEAPAGPLLFLGAYSLQALAICPFAAAAALRIQSS